MATSTRRTRRDLLRWTGLASLGAAAAPLAACAGAPKEGTTAPDSGGSRKAGGKGGTFTVYWNAGHAYAAYEKLIADFERDYDVTVNLQKYQWPDMRTRLLSDFSSGTVPDLVEEPGGWVQEFALSGDARSLQSYVDRDGAKIGFPADWQPGTVSRNSYDKEVYGIQLHLTCMLLLYNKEMLADAERRAAHHLGRVAHRRKATHHRRRARHRPQPGRWISAGRGCCRTASATTTRRAGSSSSRTTRPSRRSSSRPISSTSTRCRRYRHPGPTTPDRRSCSRPTGRR